VTTLNIVSVEAGGSGTEGGVIVCYMCIAGVTLDAKLLARGQYLEGHASGHLDTGFSWFPCVYKQMLR
jgi:hypothetical protein